MRSVLFFIATITSVLSIDDEQTFYVNLAKQTVDDSFVGQIDDSNKLFEAPYYIVPIEPLDLNELKSVLSVNLDNGKINLVNKELAKSSAAYKFTVLSIPKGTNKLIHVNFITGDSSLATTSTSRPATSPTSGSFMQNSLAQQTLTISSRRFYLINKETIRAMSVLGTLAAGSRIDCKLYCNYKPITNYMQIDSATGNIVVVNTNISINFIVIEVYHDVSTISLLYIRVVSQLTWHNYSTVVFKSACSDVNIDVPTDDASEIVHYSLVNEATLRINGHQELQRDDALFQLSSKQLQLKCVNDTQVKFLLISCRDNSCIYSFKQLSVSHENDNNSGPASCTVDNELAAVIHLESVFVSNGQPAYRLSENFLFNYQYANLSSFSPASFADFFLFQNGLFYQMNHLPANVNTLEYQLAIDVFNRTFNDVNNKFDPYVYNCRLNLKLTIHSRHSSALFFNKQFYNYTLRASETVTANDIVLKNFQNEVNMAASEQNFYYYAFQLISLTNSEGYFDLNVFTGDFMIVDITGFNNNRTSDRYLFEIQCQVANQSLSTFLEVRVLEDKTPCVPTVETTEASYSLEVGSRLPETEFIVQVLVKPCDLRTFNSRRFSFKVNPNDDTFFNYFDFNEENGIISTSDTSGTPMLTQNLFKLTIQVFDVADPSLNSTSSFDLRINFVPQSQKNQTNASAPDVSFKQRVIKAQIEENVILETLIQYLNQSFLNVASTINLQQYMFKLIDPTSSFKLIDNTIQTLPKVAAVKPLDREATNNYTLFLYITDKSTEQILYDSCVIQIDILDVNDNKPILNLVDSNMVVVNLFENLDSIYEVSLKSVDYDMGENARLTYKILNFSAINNQSIDRYTSLSGTFDLDADNGLFRVKRPLDFELYHRYEFNILIYDNGRSKQFQVLVQLILNIIDINDNAPQISSNEAIQIDLVTNFTLQQSSPSEELYLTQFLLQTTDADSDLNMNNKFNYSLSEYEILLKQSVFRNLNIYLIFRIDTLNGQLYCRLWPTLNASNQIQVDSNFSYKETNVYDITVLTSDLGLPKSLTSKKTLKLSVSLNLNKTSFDLFNNYLQLLIFNSTPLLYQNTYVSNFEEGLPTQTFVLNYRIYNTIPMRWLIWFRILSGNSDNSFRLETSININDSNVQRVSLVTNRILDREIRNTYRLRIAVFYQTNTTNPNDRILLTDYVQLFINIVDINDNAPNFLIPTLNLTVNENYEINRPIATRIRAYDADAFSIIEYSLVDFNSLANQNILKIDRYTGVLTVNANIDYETVSILRYKVVAFDGVFRTDMDLYINVADLNDNLPLLVQDQLESKFWLSGSNSSLALNAFDFDATDVNRRIVYEFYDLKNLNQAVRVTNTSRFEVGSLSNDKNLTVVIIRANNISPVFGTNVAAYSVLYLIPNNQTNVAPVQSNVGFELTEYRFYIKQQSQIGTRVGSIRLLRDSSSDTTASLKINSNQTLPFRCSLTKNQSAVDIVLVDYVNEPSRFNFELQLGNNKTRVNAFIYNNNDFYIKNLSPISVNILNNNIQDVFIKLEVNNQGTFDPSNFTISLLNDDFYFDLSKNTLTLNKTKLEAHLRNQHMSLITMADYCLGNGDSIQLSKELVFTVQSSVDESVNNIQRTDTNILVSCEYFMSLPQVKNASLDMVQFPLDHYELQIAENLNRNTTLFRFNFYPENYVKRKGFNTKYYVQSSLDFTADLVKGILRTNSTLDYENTSNREFNFQILSVIQSPTEIIKSVSTNVLVNLLDTDEFRPVLTIEKPIVYTFANVSLSKLLTQFISTDADAGSSGRTLFYFYKPSSFVRKYLKLNKFTGELNTRASLNEVTLSSAEDDEIIQNSQLLSNSLLIDLFIEVNSGLPNSLYTRGKLQLFIDYNCNSCVYSFNNDSSSNQSTTVPATNPQTSSFLSSIWSIVLICVFGVIALFLAIMLIIFRVRTSCKKRASNNNRNTNKSNTSKQTSESSLFYNSSNASTCSHISEKSSLSFSKLNAAANSLPDIQNINNLMGNTIASRATAQSLNENANMEHLFKKLTVPLSSTIATTDDTDESSRFQYLHPIHTGNNNKSHFEDYLTRLGIQSSTATLGTGMTMGQSNEHLLEKSKSSSLLTTSMSFVSGIHSQQQMPHIYHNYQSANFKNDDNFEEIDNVIIDLKAMVGEGNLANIDIQSIEDYVRLNHSRSNRNLQQQQKHKASNPVINNTTSMILATTTGSSDTGSFNNSTIDSNFNDDELSFQKWDTLLDWTPQYAPLSNIFDDLTRLNTEQQFRMPTRPPQQLTIFDDEEENGSRIPRNILLMDSPTGSAEATSGSYKVKTATVESNNDYQYCFNEDAEDDSEI